MFKSEHMYTNWDKYLIYKNELLNKAFFVNKILFDSSYSSPGVGLLYGFACGLAKFTM